MTETPPLMQVIEIDLPVDAVAAYEAALEPFCSAVASFEIEEDRLWRLTGYVEEDADLGGLGAAWAVAEAASGIAAERPVALDLPDIDWLAENRRQFPPVRAGRFFIRATIRDDRPPAGALLISLDAGPAFGSGTHETTRGCLLALQALAQGGGRPRVVLDIGTGSGILAIAAAKLWHVPVVATDIDPIAVVTTMENAARNHVAPWITAHAGVGMRAVPGDTGRADLIIANILAQPLRRMAGDVAARTLPGGHVVLSGLLTRQTSMVMARYRAHGMRLLEEWRLGPWSTLLLRRGRG